MPNALPLVTHVKFVDALLCGDSPRSAAKKLHVDKDVSYRLLRRLGIGCDRLVAAVSVHESPPASASDTLAMFASIHCAWALYVREEDAVTAAMEAGAAKTPLTTAQLVLLALAAIDRVRPSYVARKPRYARKTHLDDAADDAGIFGTPPPIHTPESTLPAIASSKRAVAPRTTTASPKARATPLSAEELTRAAAIAQDIARQRRKKNEEIPTIVRDLFDD